MGEPRDLRFHLARGSRAKADIWAGFANLNHIDELSTLLFICSAPVIVSAPAISSAILAASTRSCHTQLVTGDLFPLYTHFEVFRNPNLTQASHVSVM